MCAIVAKKFEEHGLAIPADRLWDVTSFVESSNTSNTRGGGLLFLDAHEASQSFTFGIF